MILSDGVYWVQRGPSQRHLGVIYRHEERFDCMMLYVLLWWRVLAVELRTHRQVRPRGWVWRAKAER